VTSGRSHLWLGLFGATAYAYAYVFFTGTVLYARQLARTTLWAVANWALDAAALWVFLAAYGHPPPRPRVPTASPRSSGRKSRPCG